MMCYRLTQHIYGHLVQEDGSLVWIHWEDVLSVSDDIKEARYLEMGKGSRCERSLGGVLNMGGVWDQIKALMLAKLALHGSLWLVYGNLFGGDYIIIY